MKKWQHSSVFNGSVACGNSSVSHTHTFLLIPSLVCFVLPPFLFLSLFSFSFRSSFSPFLCLFLFSFFSFSSFTSSHLLLFCPLNSLCSSSCLSFLLFHSFTLVIPRFIHFSLSFIPIELVILRDGRQHSHQEPQPAAGPLCACPSALRQPV